MRTKFLNSGRRSALSGWALNLSVVALSAYVVSDVLSRFPNWVKISSAVVGFVLLVLGVVIAPDNKGGL
jgi:threonine/homoserine/homoserine lactone efflux protein